MTRSFSSFLLFKKIELWLVFNVILDCLDEDLSAKKSGGEMSSSAL